MAMAILPPPPTKPKPRPDSVVLAGEEKKKTTLSHVLTGEELVMESSGLRVWLQLRISSQGCNWIFWRKNNSSAFGTVYNLSQDQLSIIRTPHCMRKDQAYNEPVVQESLYPLISHPIWQEQGQTLAEF